MHPYDPNQYHPYSQPTTPHTSSQPPSQHKKWYQSHAGIILMLFLFCPVGLFLMWRYARWSPQAKWIVTGILAFFVVVSGITNGQVSTSQPVGSQPQPTQQPSHATQPQAKPTQAPTPTATPTSVPSTPTPTSVRSEPTQPPAPTCNGGSVMGGVCYNTDPNGGALVYNTPPSFCSSYTCISNFSNGTGYIVECADHHWSHSGGKSGTCSRNGGVIATLYQHSLRLIVAVWTRSTLLAR